MRFLPTELPGVIVVEPDVHRDARGFFLETYHAAKYHGGGLDRPFVQDNHSHSVCRTLRGLHAQCRRPQGKLVRVVHGEIFDVAVDIRRGSPTFGRWVGVTLSGENFRQLYVPPGFAHGFCVLSETADVIYKCTALYDAADEITVRWNDADVAVRWPVEEPIVSARDGAAKRLAELADLLPVYREPAA
jgi:dTDP-4-dehydrorhamnose 3,5-epimerase